MDDDSGDDTAAIAMGEDSGDDTMDDIPIASDSFEERLPPSSEPRYSSPLPPSSEPRHSSPLPAPEPAPQTSFVAVHAMTAVAYAVRQWNKEWGTVLQWSDQFSCRYLAAVKQMRVVEFIEEVKEIARDGRSLMNEVAHVMHNSLLPTTSDILRTFIDLTVKLLRKLIEGVAILDSKVKSTTSLFEY